MKKQLNGEMIANEVRMLRPSKKTKSFLLVEGIDDDKFFSKFVSPMHCEIIVTHGKEYALAAIASLNRTSTKGTICIIDSDFINIYNFMEIIQNVLTTDTHDIETLIIKSSAFETVLKEHASHEKITKSQVNVRDSLIECALFIGYFRYYSFINNLHLDFKDLPYEKLIDKKTLLLNSTQLIDSVLKKSQIHNLDAKKIHADIIALSKLYICPWQLCNGHDLVSILSLGLRRLFGSAQAVSVERALLEKDLRLAYDKTLFVRTKLYSSCCDWASRNKPFAIF